jgi:iron complex transport system substrate-binding protein
MKKVLAVLLCIMLILSLSSCTKSAPDTSQGKTEEGYPLTVTDSLGREVVLEKAPQKFVSLSPAITEILFALGAGEQVIGVSEYCDYPEEALEKPKMGDFTNPNFEVILEAEPDIIFVAAGIQEDFINRFSELGVQIAVLDAENVEQVLENIELAGKIANRNTEAKELKEELQDRIQTVKEKIAATDTTPSVFFEVWDDPLMTAGPGSFIHDLIELAGGKNIAEDLPERFAEFSKELLLSGIQIFIC